MASSLKRFISRFRPQQAAKASAIDYITAGGYFGDQIEGLEELTKAEDFVDNFAIFCKSLIPHLNARKDSHMRDLLRRWLENYESYKANTRAIEIYIKQADTLENEDDIQHSEKLKPELDFTKNIKHQMLTTDAMIIFSLTFEKLPYKTIVLDKPYILNPRGGFSGNLPPDNFFKGDKE